MKRFRARVRPRWILGFIALGLLAVTVFGSLVMLLWNALFPPLFHLPLITFWQALGLLLLAKILFGGFRGGPGRRWKRRMDVDCENISQEDKERIRQEWGRRCGRRFGDAEDFNRRSAPDPGQEKARSTASATPKEDI
ncbi:MAG: hypothetical protein Q8927_08735 [Bacteroidota bacterium]|nr:hypothetical protein [Bacteroidota bacterium]MDP4216275.1 hypothetical protein [Bacteroidota bacterium]MDP4244440.1 hypothetical protein [Bacteroidota bacterium]MDP4255328.1 hypothetical protein [Bacteroidota bacterium]MDP4260351.1 hypothetical protein [Bacteroidota bacterium]